MNTYTNAMHPKKDVHRTARNHRFHNAAIVTIILVLVTAAALAVYTSNRPAVAAEKAPAWAYGNALEMQYAQPWLDAQNKPVVTYGNALELQYAQPWLDAQQQILLNCHSSLEMLYACQNGYGRP